MNKKGTKQDKKHERKKVCSKWTSGIMKIPELAQFIKVNLQDKEKLSCNFCYANGNKSSAEFAKVHIINHFEKNKKHLSIVQQFNKGHLNHQIIEQLIAIKYNQNEASSVSSDEGPDETLGPTYELKSQALEKDLEGDEMIKEMSKDLKFTISKFIVQHRLPFALSDPLLELIKSISNRFPNSVLNNTTLSRITCAEIIRECICPSLKEEIIMNLTQSPYSLSLDETSDRFGSSYLAVMATYLPQITFDSTKGPTEPITKLASIIELEESHTGEAIYKKLQENFFALDKRLSKNLIGISTDGGSNLFGTGEGLAGQLIRNIKHMISAHDLSHIFNLICKKALNAFPSKVINIIKSISSHFKHSSIRRAKLKKIQRRMGKDTIYEVLSYTPLRWLSLSESLNRILLLWEPLRIYYNENGDEEEKEYFITKNEVFLRILAILLAELAHYNRGFQKTNIYYDEIFRNLNQSFLTYTDIILNEKGKEFDFQSKYDLEWSNTDLNKVKEHLSSKDQFFLQFMNDYTDLQNLLPDLDEESSAKIYKSCQKFILKIIVEMKHYFPYNKEIIKDCDVVFLKVFDKEKWKVLAKKFDNLVSLEEERDFMGELGRFQRNFLMIKEEAKNEDILLHWNRLEKHYPLIGRLAKVCFFSLILLFQLKGFFQN